MAESIRELIVTLSLEAGTFSKTCSDINAQIKGVEAQFNAITAGTDGWQTTIAGRKAKIDALTETFSLQQAKISTIAGELERAKTALAADPGNLGAARKVSSLETQLNNATTAAALTKAEIEKLNLISLTAFGTKLEMMGTKLKTFGRRFSLYIGGPLAALGVKSYNAALDYESALVSMQKTVDETDTTKYQDISDAFLEMSENGPMSYTELMELAGQAGAYGVLADNIVKTVESVAMLKVTADDLDASTGMGQLTQLMNITERGDYSNIENVGSSLTDLGNKLNATEAQILAMAQRMAATGELAGVETTQILAMAAGFTSVGIEAEAGGSAAGKLMKKMQLAAEVGSKAVLEFAQNSDTAGMSIRDIQLAADDSKWVTGIAAGMEKTKAEIKSMIDSMVALQQFSGVMGVTPGQFTEGWDANAGQSMLDFFDGLSKIEKSQGESTILSKLDEMGLTEIRTSNLIAAASTNPELFKRAFKIADEAYEANIALSAEAEKRYATAESHQQTQLNILENASADVGENVVDAVQPLIEKVTSLVGEFGKLDEATQDKWVTIAGALIMLGPAAMTIGAVEKTIGGLIGHLVKLDKNSVSNWTKLAGAFTSPFGLGILSAVAIGGSIYMLDQYMSSISDNTSNVIERLKNIEIGLDETKYKAVTDALAQIQAQADALSGETGEYNKNISVAVKAGYGTESMYGTALGYEALLTEQEIAGIAGQYADEVDRLNGAIGAAVSEAERAALAKQRDAAQTQWDAKVTTAKQRHMDNVSALVSGMMAADPEAKKALEQASMDYDQIAMLTKAQADVMQPGITNEQTDAIWKNFFTPSIMQQYFDGIKYEDLVPGAAALDLENKLLLGMEEALKTAGGENSLAATLLQSILDNPLAAGTFDQTKVTGALDGIIELLDYKAAGEKAGTEYGTALTAGLADGLALGTETATTAGGVMATAVDASITSPLGIQSPSTVMRQHGLDIGIGIQLGILDGLPLAAAAMNVLGAALTAIASANGTTAGAAYGSAFSSAASIQLSAAMGSIKRELDQLNIRINRGYGNTGR